MADEIKKEEAQPVPPKEYTEQEIRAMNIYEKMLAMQTEAGWVKKNLTIDMKNDKTYKAVGDVDVLEAAKPLEAKYRVWSFPSDTTIIDSGMLDQGNYQKLWLRIQTITRFVNVDNPEQYVEITTYGDGIDNGDKAPGKGMTYSGKYGLLKGLKLSTGDDPDAQGSNDEFKGLNKSQNKGNSAPKSTQGANTPSNAGSTAGTGTTPPAVEYATPAQITFMKQIFSKEELAGFLDFWKIDALTKITKKNASACIDKRQAEKAAQKEQGQH